MSFFCAGTIIIRNGRTQYQTREVNCHVLQLLLFSMNHMDTYKPHTPSREGGLHEAYILSVVWLCLLLAALWHLLNR